LEDGIDVFLSIPEDKLEQWKPLLTLITNQFLKHFERRPEQTAKPILFLLDEFPRLGKIENIMTALTTLRSKKITIALIIQSLAQLDYLYGRDCRRVILDNCAYKAILGASDAEAQEYFSRLVGTHNVIQQSISTSYGVPAFLCLGYTSRPESLVWQGVLFVWVRQKRSFLTYPASAAQSVHSTRQFLNIFTKEKMKFCWRIGVIVKTA